VANGTAQENRTYCSKDGNFEEFGDINCERGKRTDLQKLIEWSDAFEVANGRPADSPDVAKEHPEALIKYPRFTRTVRLRAQRVLFEPVVFYGWQQQLAERMEEEPDDRVIDFVVDEAGGSGKTTFCKQLLMKKPECVQILSIGKTSDVAHAIIAHKTIFLFNVPRTKMEFLSYDLLEQLKDQLVWSGKYNSMMKVIRKKCHVVVFANEDPDMTKLTADRYNIIRI